MTQMNHADRLGRLQERLDASFLVSNLSNVRYLTGFTGSNGLMVVWPERAVFLTDSRYGEAAEELVAALPRTDICVYQGPLTPVLADVLAGTHRVQLETEAVTWGFSRRLDEAIDADLVPTEGIVEALRLVKDDSEIAALRAAAEAGDAAFAALDGLVARSKVEADLGWALVDEMRAHGAEPAGWAPIVAAGAGASVPHYRSGPEPVGSGLLLMDYGCVVDGYHSDMTRTVWLGGGEPDAEMAKIHDVVAESQRAAIDRVAPGTRCSDVDEEVRRVLRAYGYEEHFLHSTGHGVGLDIHEGPRVAQTSDEVLEAGHVITIEPGVYLPGKGGVRIEDMVLVTDDGPVELTSSPKELVRT